MRAILAGHLHYSTSGTFAGIPVSVAAATCYTMNLARPAVEVNGMDAGQSFHLVHVYDDTITHAVVPVVEAPTGDYFSAEWVERMAALTPEERLEAFSRKPADAPDAGSPRRYSASATRGCTPRYSRPYASAAVARE